MAKARGAKLHIAMFPWLAFGHIIPFLEYAKFLVQKGHRISFISTPKNIDRLPKIPPELATSIQCFQNRTGPAGSTGWTANRTCHRSGLKLKPEINRKPLETG
ncbi:unnamed protein product [Coffea canephora]|uniref:Uncharacterized protein n=1 Tax=Coffea canephora TaxID=49390 RepID=A0A068U4J9_COFCA|nr:unnamed protein product [Coffea canephora]